jgi:hypothetical protein
MDANRTRRDRAIADSQRPVDETLVLNAYETLEVLVNSIATLSGEAAFEELLRHTKRALTNPGSQVSRSLMRAIARYEVVNKPVPDDPELHK